MSYGRNQEDVEEKETNSKGSIPSFYQYLSIRRQKCSKYRRSKSNLECVHKDVEARNQKHTEPLNSEDVTVRLEMNLKEEDMEKMYQELCAARSEIVNIQKSLKVATTVSAIATFETSTLLKQLRV